MIELRECQVAAIQKMKNGCILCGGVGSGKSRTSLTYYYLQNGGNIDHVLRKRLINDQWQYTFKYVNMKKPKDLYIITTARKRDTGEWEKELGTFLISTHPEVSIYQHKVVIDSWNNIKKYQDVANAFFIFDEQRVVGSGSWVKSFLNIVKVNAWILLSATPGDTWIDYIPVFIANGFYRNRTEFNDEHVVWKRTKNYWVVSHYVNTGRLQRLRASILVDIDFVRETVQHHENVATFYDQNLYKMIVRNRWDYEKDKPIESASEYCQLLRKLVNSDISRQEAVLSICKDHKRVIVFYNYNYERDILKSLQYPDGTIVAEWNGHNHEPIPDSDRWVYLVQYTAGAEGWNCILTDTMIFYSQSYSYKVMTQASGRIDRMNTPFKNLYYYHLISRSGIDMAIARALNQKKQFNERDFIPEFKGEKENDSYCRRKQAESGREKTCA